MKTKLLSSALLALGVAIGVQAQTTYNMYVTCYGWLDNSPPGNAIAYPQIHSGAGGTGTYSDPVTFATDQAELAPGTRVYVSYVKRYFIMEDDCAQCDSDWGSGKRHIDLWAGGNSSSGQPLLDCEDSLTRSSAPVIVNPANNLTVDTTPLFNSSTKQCYVPGSGGGGGGFSGYYKIVDRNSTKVAAVQNASTTNGAPVILWTFGSAQNDQWSLVATDSGYYQIVNRKSGKVMAVKSASTADNAPVIQWTFGSAQNDQWQPVSLGGGYYNLINRHSGLYLNVKGAASVNGTPFVQYHSTGGLNEQFQLVSTP